jgi:hypothetical protein
LLIPTSIFAQSYTGILSLDSIPSSVSTGDTITFSGTLTTTNGGKVTDALIYIKDNVTFDTDTVMGTITTDDNGRFSATWEAVPRSSGSYDFYAIYEGGGDVSKSRSVTYKVTVGSSSGSSSNTGTSSSSSYLPTSITLDRLPSSIYAGQSITFTGKLTSSGSPIPNTVVKIMEDDPFKSDQTIATGRTNSNGQFSIPWTVSGGYVEQDFDIYSTFDNDSKYSYARSYNQEMSILRYGGSITLDRIQSSAEIGDVVEFSGTLQLNQGSSKGAIVYIKDEDPFTGDDLLATAYVDSSGRFSANWFVNYVDADDVVDIYAVFEGNNILARQTTCDAGSTMPIGGSCLNTIPLRITGSNLPPPLPPTGTGTTDPTLSGNEYMKLYYSLDLNRNPKVAIIPSPDSYDEAKRYVGSVQEGIKMWESALDRKFGGTWNVSFEVIAPGTLFFNNPPDIVMNIVTADEDIKCLSEYSGWAKVWRGASKPVQTQVCTTSPDIGATAAHEFIHAMGLGHAFNKKGDLMCSAELVGGQWIPTCPSSFSRSSQPSDFNLAATGFLYNSDGFKNPNNRVSYESKFTTSDYLEGNTSPSTNPVSPNPSKPIIPPTTTVTPPNTTSDYDGDGILDSKDECKFSKENFNGYQDSDGCFDVKPKDTRVQPTLTTAKCFSDYISKQYKQAISCYTSIVKANPSDFQSGVFLGLSYEGISDYDSALSIFQKLNQLFPNNPNGWNGMARNYSELGKCELAVMYYEKVIKHSPDHIEAKTFLNLQSLVCPIGNDSSFFNTPETNDVPTSKVGQTIEKQGVLIDFSINALNEEIKVFEGVELEGKLSYISPKGNEIGIPHTSVQLKSYDRFSVIETLSTDYAGNFKWEVSRNNENYDEKTGTSSWDLYLYYEANERYHLNSKSVGTIIVQNPNIIPPSEITKSDISESKEKQFCFLWWCW